MNQRNYILEAMAEGKTPADHDVMLGAAQYYTNLITDAIFPVNNTDIPSAIVALETTAMVLRENNRIESHIADIIKSMIDCNTYEFRGKTQDMEVFHQSVHKNAPK